MWKLVEYDMHLKTSKWLSKQTQWNVSTLISLYMLMVTVSIPIASCFRLSSQENQPHKNLRTSEISNHFIGQPFESYGSQNVTTNIYQSYSQFPKTKLLSFNLIYASRESLCDTHCYCERNNKFVTVSCNYQQNTKLSGVFDSKYRVPMGTTSVVITLAGTEFILRSGFFEQNKVNSIRINGTNNKKDQVELTKDSLNGVGGGYPEIIIENIFSVIIREGVFNGDMRINITNSNDLVLFSNAFANSTINAFFSNIKDLRIYEKAFSAGKVLIEDSYLGDIFRFEASLNEIRFYHCTIETINAGAFDVNSINSIVFESCRIDAIKARAVTDKLLSNHVSIKNGIIGYIESEAIFGSGITELVLSKNSIEKIYTNAIHATAVNVTITNNSIKNLDNDWLHIKQWSNVNLENNRFGIFGSIKLEESARPSSCKFHNNSITKALRGSLNIFECQMHYVSINIDCSCKTTWLSILTDHDLRSETYCRIDKRLSSCFGTSNLNYLKYLNEVCNEKKTTISCPGNQTLEKVNGNFYTKDELAQNNPIQSIIFFIISICLVSIIFIVVIIYIIWWCNKRCRNSSEPLSPSMHHLHEFSASDRSIILQSLTDVEKRYKEIYKPLKKQTEHLLMSDLSDKECIKTVSKIISLLGKIPSQTEDFNCLNQILTQHLQPHTPNAPLDPIYTEPTTNLQNSELFSMNGIRSFTALSNQITYSEQGNVNDGPIYSEPNCAQQPLLQSEYASPADRNYFSPDVYTEPVTEIVPLESRLITASQPLRHISSISENNLTKGLKELPPNVFTKQPGITSNVQLTTFSIQSPSSGQNGGIPIYTKPYNHKKQNLFEINDPQRTNKAFQDGKHSSSNPDSNSNHSGGTQETVPIDDIIAYVDD